MSKKSHVRKLPVLSSVHIPLSHRRFQNRAAAVYDMSIDCHDIGTVCHIHRLSESVIIQDWKGDFNYLKIKLNFQNRQDIQRRFELIMKEIQEDNMQPTLAAIAHSIPFIYIEQALHEQDISNALHRFLDDFNPKKFVEVKIKDVNVLQKQFNDGRPVLTPFEKHLLLEHFKQSLTNEKFRRLIDIEKCLLRYIQMIMTTNYPSLEHLSHLDQQWLKTFLQWACPQIDCKKISWLNLEQF